MTENQRKISSTTSSSTERSSNRSTSTTTTVYTDPGVSWNLQVLRETWNGILGPMTAQVAWYIEDLMAKGMAIEVILDAVQETAWARRPSPQYFRAITQRLMREGVLTMEQLQLSREEFARQKAWWEEDARMPY